MVRKEKIKSVKSQTVVRSLKNGMCGKNPVLTEKPPYYQIKALQRSVGNKALQTLLKSWSIKGNMKIRYPTDRSEQEADRITDQFEIETKMRPMDVSEIRKEYFLHSKSSHYNKTPVICPINEEHLQGMKDNGRSLSPDVRSYSLGNEAALRTLGLWKGPHLGDRVVDQNASRRKRTDRLVDRLVPMFGLAGDKIEVHIDDWARRETEAYGGCGLMRRGRVFLHPRKYDPNTLAGKALLGHEMAHVAQRRGGRARPAGAQCKPAAEQEAGVLGLAFAEGHAVRPPEQALPTQAVAASSRKTEAEKAKERAKTRLKTKYLNKMKAAASGSVAKWNTKLKSRKDPKVRFLGLKFPSSIHEYLLNKLKSAEKELLNDPKLKGLVKSQPVKVGKPRAKVDDYSEIRKAVGISDISSVIRPNSLSYHGLGLAIDIDSKSNPWLIQEKWINRGIRDALKFFYGISVQRRSKQLRKFLRPFWGVPFDMFRHFRRYVGKKWKPDPDQALKVISMANEAWIRYLKLYDELRTAKRKGRLVQALAKHDVGFEVDYLLDQSKNKRDSRKSAEAFYKRMRTTLRMIKNKESPKNWQKYMSKKHGFMSMKPRLIRALLKQNLCWGGTERWSKGHDLMHFDTRYGPPLTESRYRSIVRQYKRAFKSL